MPTTAEVRRQAKLHKIERPHPGPRTYVKVAAFLGFITAIEIVLSYIDLNKWALIPSLVVLSILKFVIVVQWFMHLRFDHPTLRKPFIAGITTALTVYTIVLVNLVYHSRTVG